MNNSRSLGSVVVSEAIRLWPSLATRWTADERDVLAEHAGRLPLGHDQATAALRNLKATLLVFPQVPHFLTALKAATARRADPAKPTRWHNCSPEGIARLRAKFAEYAAMPPHQVVAEQYAGFPMRSFASLNHFRRCLAEDLAFHGCPSGEVAGLVEWAREEAEALAAKRPSAIAS